MTKVNFILTLSLIIALYAQAVTYYVDASRPDDTGAGTSWGEAKKTIQAAVNLAVSNDTVLVTNGVYNTGTTVTPGYTLNNRVVITNSITVRSINGPDVTSIEGSGTNWYNTSSAVRCVYMKRGVLDGFTLGGGATYGSGLGSSWYYDRSGGGVNMYNSVAGTLVTNCLIIGCSAHNGGGSSYGTLNNCLLFGNTAASFGGGSYYGTLNNCLLFGNTAAFFGGGSYYGTLNNCTFTGNTAISGGCSCDSTLNNCTLTGNTATGGTSADYGGGGSRLGTLNNCIVWGNTAAANGGGSLGGTLNNCIVWGNTAAANGGGSSYGTLNNCTISGNVATNGCGSYKGSLRNCIVWGNTLTNGLTDNYSGGTFSYSCTTPLPAGAGNIALDPRFVGANDLRLRDGSPCIDGGNNSYATLPTDLASNPRIQNGVVDMGAYEGGVFVMVVTFDPRGGTVPVPASKTVTYGQAYGSLATTTRTGYYGFEGWYTNAACTGAVVTDSTMVGITSDHSLFAKWVKQATSLGPVPVPYSWLNLYPVLLQVAGGNYEVAALIDPDLDGYLAWQEYVAGSAPTDNASVFRAGIDVIGGEPQVSWTPNLGTARVYTVEGKTNLTDAVWGPTNSGSRFYRVTVDMP